MAFEKLSNSIRELNENIQTLSKSNAEYFKLKFFKQGIKGAIGLVNALLLFFFGVFALLFISFAAAVAISAALDSPSAGYWIVAGFYVLILILILLFRKKLGKLILTKASEAFFN
ncbi:phage holin family protein [Zunongwangia sp. F363]|uniref:Phage holin family protein n=1 Tax=Autumnicola tepida TaxID=3075595 RepID=A0ABU3C8M6_9FLAO|nr:phage holin family protein [Zunongwangia sp. F363]MDT0642695.1 phage holin family protein [Zunongwangia sp. F363]